MIVISIITIAGVTLRSLCPTLWTVRTAAFKAVIDDYVVLQKAMEEVSETTHDEYSQRANCMVSSLAKFDTLFGLMLGFLLFGASEQLSRTLHGTGRGKT